MSVMSLAIGRNTSYSVQDGLTYKTAGTKLRSSLFLCTTRIGLCKLQEDDTVVTEEQVNTVSFKAPMAIKGDTFKSRVLMV